MTNINNNNLPLIKKVRELKEKYKIPSYEKFMKTYQEDEGMDNNYYYEIDSYKDIKIIRPFDPGFLDDLNRDDFGKAFGRIDSS
ncbi:16668_t:CDS:1, partial [Funneliformis caledonium]